MYLNEKIIGTHNGIFHEDDVLAVVLLSILYDDKIVIKRTRDKNILNNCHIVVDVGGGKYDHHDTNTIKLRDNGIPYASAGLIWQDFGLEILKKLGASPENLSSIKKDIDYMLIQPVDKKDNGINIYSPMAFVESYLPLWTEKDPDYNKAFLDVVNVSKEIVKKIILQTISEHKANNLIERAISKAQTENTNIVFLPCQTIPWKNTIISHNFMYPTHSNNSNFAIDFVVFPYPDGGYAAQCVPKNHSDIFSKRIPFPEEWSGQTINLPEVCGISDATFCHINGFFARAKTKEAIVEMCNKATKNYKSTL